MQDDPTHPAPALSPADGARTVVRRATPADAAAVRELTRAAYAKWVPVIGREPRPMTADYDAAVRDHVVDLLHGDGKLVGLIEMAPAADHLLVVNVAVAPASQGRGYGRALVAHAEEVARSLGLGEVRLYTNGRFAENVRLYGRLGYRVDREEVHPQFGVAVYMSKPVRSGTHGSALQTQPSAPEKPGSPHPPADAIRAGLRRAAPADAAAVRDLTRAAYAKWVPVLGREPKPMAADYDKAVRDHVVDMLHLDGEPAALIEMRPEADHLLVVNVAVSPAHQGRGYGRALLAHAEEVARSLGLGETRLYTSGRLTENLKLYERVGYRVDREEEASPHLGVFAYMSKRLSAPASSPVRVRPPGPGDHDAWLPLWEGYQDFYKVPIPDGTTRATWSRLLDPAEPMHAALATDHDGRAVGLVHWLTHRSTWTPGDYCYLQDLFVAPEARGRGAGRALIEHVYREAAALGCPRVYWLTHETNRDAMALYDRVADRTGFVQYRKALG